MSDGARKRQKLKINMTSKNGTPQGSRSGSPERPTAVPAAKAGAGGGSRVESPGNFQFSFTLTLRFFSLALPARSKTSPHNADSITSTHRCSSGHAGFPNSRRAAYAGPHIGYHHRCSVQTFQRSYHRGRSTKTIYGNGQDANQIRFAI